MGDNSSEKELSPKGDILSPNFQSKDSTDQKYLKDCLEPQSTPPLSLKVKFCYGVGHVFNDLCASMWFSYLLIFFEKVIVFPDTLAGLILLVGQLADGISTPIVGIFSDKENKFPICARYGRRKVWHLIGTFCVAISFPFIFSPAYGLEDSSDTIQAIYYTLFVVVFQFGWASVQISHLALIPDLTPKKSQRTELNSIRYGFTVLANLSVYTLTYFILGYGGADENEPTESYSTTEVTTLSTMYPFTNEDGPFVCDVEENSLSPTDLNEFRTIAICCVGVGLFFSLIFHWGVQEPQFICPKNDGTTNNGQMRKKDWFKQPPLYLVAILYMATRLYVNLYQVYIPLFVQDTLCLAKTAVATIPFTMYLAGFFGSLAMKQVNKLIGRKGTYASGCAFGLAGCIWAFAGGYPTQENFVTWGVFIVAVLLGIGGSTLLITSLSITADLIGKNTEGGAFVYGLMSFVDKVSNGVIIMLIQDFNTGVPAYYRKVIFYACGGSCVLGLLTTAALIPVKVGKRRGVALSVVSLIEEERYETSSTGSSPGRSLRGHDNLGSVCVDTISATVDNSPSASRKGSVIIQDDLVSSCMNTKAQSNDTNLVISEAVVEAETKDPKMYV